MKSRHRAREVALQILYQYDLHSSQQAVPKDAAITADLKYHFDHFRVPDGLREFATQLVAGTLQKMPELDLALEKHASNWKVARMSSVDRSLLRMAVYEMLHLGEISPTIVIDEAVELAKQFGTSETPGFVNGILDSIRAQTGKPDEA